MKELISRLNDCTLSEEQAIAIYEAECWILKRTSLTIRRQKSFELCKEILKEEKEHRKTIGSLLPEVFAHDLKRWLSRVGGYALGTALSALPSRLNWKIHVWAEIQAAEVYKKAAELTASIALDGVLLNSLRQAERQEREHSLKFSHLMKCSD